MSDKDGLDGLDLDNETRITITRDKDGHEIGIVCSWRTGDGQRKLHGDEWEKWALTGTVADATEKRRRVLENAHRIEAFITRWLSLADAGKVKFYR